MQLLLWLRKKTPAYERLASAVEATVIELEQQRARVAAPTQAGLFRTDAVDREPQLRLETAEKCLQQTRQLLANARLERGWDVLQTAQRELLACDLHKARRVASALRHEADKISGWRSKAIEAALKKATSPPPGTGSELDWILEAAAVRDEYYRTMYFRIALRRRHLLHISCILLAALTAFLVLCWYGFFRDVLDEPTLVPLVVIFGVLGAGLSVSQGLLWSDVTSKIPTQQVRAFVVWMRPVIGAAAALSAVVLLRTALQQDPGPALILATALTAGFSERYIVGAVDRFAKSQDKKSD